MNYYNPYFYTMPISNTPKINLFSRLFGNRNLSFSSILTGTQKVLNIANQTIPLVKQVKPVIGNAKTMFKVMSEFKKNDNFMNEKTNKKSTYSHDNINNQTSNNGPVFFA